MNEEPKDDEIATLIRLAGRRPAVSEERAARVRQNVRQEWLQATRQRTRYRWLAAAAAISVAVLGVTLARRASQMGPAPAAPAVRVIRTEAQFAVLDWNGVALRLNRDTQIRILSPRTLILDRGALYFDGEGARREIRTRFGSIRDIGTRFDVQTGEVLRVRVRDGRVAFRGITVDSGMELIDRGAAIELHAVSRTGDTWAWVEESAPPVRLEGMTLRNALLRVAREKGLTVKDIPNGDVLLHGDVPLSPSEALEAATAAAGVKYRIRGEQLIVTRR